MTDKPEKLTLIYLRRLDAKMDRMIGDMHDVKVSLTLGEEGMAGINRRIDRLEERIDRIEGRLDLADARH